MNYAKNLLVRQIAFPVLALVAAAFVTAIPASASTLAWTAPGAVSEYDVQSYENVADVFTVTSSETVTNFGIYILPDQYTTDEVVGLYNSSGTLLASVDINEDVATQTDGYYWASPLSQGVHLTAGQTYTLDVYTNGAIPAYGYSSTAPIPGWATFESGEDASGNSLADPIGDTVAGTAFYGADMEGTATPTPEPDSLLLLGSGLIGMAGFLRFKLRKN